jgi:hypothetical protein
LEGLARVTGHHGGRAIWCYCGACLGRRLRQRGRRHAGIRAIRQTRSWKCLDGIRSAAPGPLCASGAAACHGQCRIVGVARSPRAARGFKGALARERMAIVQAAADLQGKAEPSQQAPDLDGRTTALVRGAARHVFERRNEGGYCVHMTSQCITNSWATLQPSVLIVGRPEAPGKQRPAGAAPPSSRPRESFRYGTTQPQEPSRPPVVELLRDGTLPRSDSMPLDRARSEWVST